MLVYIIDGFNLIHKIPALKNSSFPRRELIHYIRIHRLTGSRNNRVVIVFDGWANPEVSLGKEYRLVFSRERKADELITEIVRRSKPKSEIIVVSDDRQIRRTVSREGARVCGTLDFIKTKAKLPLEKDKELSYTLQREITEEMRRVWLKKEE